MKPWMLEAPKNGDPNSITKDDKEYHWCPKCAKGEGQWVCHKPKDHSDNFKPKKKSESNNKESSGSSKSKGKKSSNTSSGGSLNGRDSSGTSGTSLRFNRAALLSVAASNNADTQTFLSQFVPGKE